MASLMQLSNELKLLIIAELTAISPPSTATADAINEYDEDCGSQLGELEHVPPIPPYAGAPPHLFALYQTSSLFRTLLAPNIWEKVTLQNTPESGTFVSELAKSDRARFVKSIEYIAAVPLPDLVVMGGNNHLKTPPTGSEVPPEVDHVLSNLSFFPNLDSVNIHFPFKLHELMDNIEIQSDFEGTADEVQIAESTQAWRALMTSSYTSLARNAPGVVKTLTLRDLVVRESSAWETPAWRALLGGLTRFSVNVRGWDNGAGWQTCTFNMYTEFIDNFDHYFFDHLDNITHLSLAFSESGPAGPDAGYTGPLTFKKRHMPHLQSITLDYVFVGAAVLKLLQTHASNLRSVHMKHAYAMQSWWHVDLTWTQFFDALRATTPFFPNLQTFRLESTLTESEAIRESRADEWNDDMTQRITPAPADDAEIKSKWHNQLLDAAFDDKYGYLDTDAGWREYQPERAQQKRSDWNAYQRFMQLVAAGDKWKDGPVVAEPFHVEIRYP
jgi:hypothetical protein